MKKLIVLVLILVITPFFIVSEEALNIEALQISRKNSKNPETKNWEYVKTRLFDGETSDVYRKEALLLVVQSASKKDSLGIQKAIDDIKEILPNKDIAFFNDFTGISYEDYKKRDIKLCDTINGHPRRYIASSMTFLSFIEVGKLETVNNNWPGADSAYPIGGIGSVQHSNFKDRKGKTKAWPRINFAANDHTWSYYFDERAYVRYELMRLLCHIPDYSGYIPENSVFSSKHHDPNKYSVLERDIFLLQKLYSDDFLEQFEVYLYEHYPWSYVNAFLDKKMSDRKATLIVFGLGLLVFVLMISTFQKKSFKYSFLNYFLPILFLLFQIANLHFVYEYLTYFNSFIGWDENIKFVLIVVPLFALLISVLLWSFDTYVVKESMNFTLQLLLKVTFTFIAFNIVSGLVLLLNRDANIYNPEFQDFYFPILFLWLGLSIGRGLLLYLNQVSESLVKEKDVELSKLKEVNAQAEVKLLQSQINPHFLYNALNSIATLAKKDGEKTEKMVLSLSDLFKYSINRKGKKSSTIKDEIEMVQNYLEIEQIRFGDRLQFNIDVPEELASVKIPMFIIQPLVENAVKHGISKNEGNGEISLKIEKSTDGITILVEDNGPDFPDGLVSGHGLQTVYDLLRLSYGEDASMRWSNEPEKGIVIFIKI